MKRLGAFPLPPGWDASPSQVTPPQFVMFPQQFAGTHFYSWVERGTVRVECNKTIIIKDLFRIEMRRYDRKRMT